jgi:hypothetical protein
MPRYAQAAVHEAEEAGDFTAAAAAPPPARHEPPRVAPSR